MPSFSIKDKQTALHSFNADNTLIKFGVLFCALSLLAGFLISSSTILAIVFIAALFGIIIILRPEIGLYLMVLAIPLEAVSAVAESLTALKLIGWVVLAGWVLNIALTKKRIIFPREGWYLVAFIAWGLISAFWAVDPDIVIGRIPTTIQLLGFYIVVINLVDSRERIRYLFWALLIGCMIASGLTLFYFKEAYLSEGVQGGRIAIGSVNHFPATLLLVVPFLFLSAIFSESNLLRFCSLGAAGFIMMIFFTAMSRGAVLGLMVIVMIILIKYRKYMPRLIVFIPIILLAGLYFMPEEFWLRMVSGFTLEDRAAKRLDIWLVSWNMVKDNLLLGVGLSNHPVSFDFYRAITTDLVRFPGSSRPPHNIYLGAVTELGIVGGALLLMIVVGYLRKGYKAVKIFDENKDQSAEIIVFSVLLSFMGLLVVGIALDILYRKYFWISMALIEAVCLTTPNSHPAGKKETIKSPPLSNQ
jgi:O-antigen ligase